ncbi:MAG: hypothetical protein ABR976_13690 [Terracidiphilus sp.]|jgi:hypothetical protein
MPEPWKPLTGLDELEDAAREQKRRPRAADGEYAIKSEAPRCALCGSPILIEFYRVNSKLACAKCGVAARSGYALASPDSYVHGLTYGVFAAAVAMAVYALFTIVTHFYLGYVAVAVGWLIGKAMMKGSKGVGGPRYQMAAAILTYLAVSLAAVPIRVASFSAAGDMNWGSELLPMALWGLLSPVLYLQYPVFGFVGLLLLIAGMRIAWRTTAARRMLVDGPHTVLVA